MFDEDINFEDNFQEYDSIFGGVNPIKQQYQKTKDINKKEKIEKTIEATIEEKEKERKKAKLEEKKIIKVRIAEEEIRQKRKEKINLLNTIDIKNDNTTIQNYYDILENLYDFLYQDNEFYNVLKTKINKLLQYEEILYNEIKKNSSIFNENQNKFDVLNEDLKKYNNKFGIIKNDDKFKTIINKFIKNDKEKINEWINKIDIIKNHISLIPYDENTYLFNNEDILKKFDNVFLSEVFLNNEDNITKTIDQIDQNFIKNYIDLNNLTNDFYNVIDLYLTTNGINDYKKNAQNYLDKILSNINGRQISRLFGDLKYEGYIKHDDIKLKLKGKILFIGDVHGDIVPIINLIRNSNDIGDLTNRENWEDLHIIFLGDVIDPFNGSNARICNDNDYVILNNIKTRMAICDMHLCIFFLIYLALKGANIYYILGNHDIHYAFSNKLFLYLLDCKTKGQFDNLKFYTKFELDIGEEIEDEEIEDEEIEYKNINCLINHTPNTIYNLENFFECHSDWEQKDGENIEHIRVKTKITIDNYQDAYINKSNFNIKDNIYNSKDNLTQNWTNDYLVKTTDGIGYLNKKNLEDKPINTSFLNEYIVNNFNEFSPIIICGHKYKFYDKIFNITVVTENGSNIYKLVENNRVDIDIKNNINELSLDYNTTYYKFNCFDDLKNFDDLTVNESYKTIIWKILEKIMWIKDGRYNYDPEKQHSYTYDHFQYIKSKYLTHDRELNVINSDTINDSGFIYGSIAKCTKNANDEVNCEKRCIIYQPLNYSIKIKLSIENQIYNNNPIFQLFKNSTNSFLCYNPNADNKESVLCPLNDVNGPMNWFNLYVYDPIIVGDDDIKYAFTKNKKELYNVDEINKVGNLINNVIFSNNQFVRDKSELTTNLKRKLREKLIEIDSTINYKHNVYGLLKDDKRVNFDILQPNVKDLINRDVILLRIVRHNINGGENEQTYKYSLNQLSSTTLTYIIFYKHLIETKEQDNTFISFVCTYIKYLLTKDYEKEENKDKKLLIKELVKFFDGKFNYHYNLQDSDNKKYYKSWYEETPEFKSMFKINANRFINQLDFEHSLYDYTDLYYAALFISKNYYFDVKEIMEIIKKNKEKLDNKKYIDVYNIIYKNIKKTTLSYLDYDFMFLICHFIVLLYVCSISNKHFEEILEQCDIKASKLFKLIIDKFNKENILKDINESEDNYNVIELCNKILKDNELIKDKTESKEEKIKDSLDLLDKIRKSIGLESKDNDYLSDSQDMFKYSIEDKHRFNENLIMSTSGGSSDEELF